MSNRKRSISVSSRWPVPVWCTEALLAVRLGGGAGSPAGAGRAGRRFGLGRLAGARSGIEGVDLADALRQLPPLVCAVHEMGTGSSL